MGTDIWHRVWREVLIPGELKIEELLLTKIELLEEEAIPDFFLAFMTHARVARSYLETGQGVEYFEKACTTRLSSTETWRLRTNGLGALTKMSLIPLVPPILSTERRRMDSELPDPR